ncbi:hypothetical protein OH77DRAFT_1431233 [Trametes cingulata]|nr:hypothetical protein OH77DRAFT_1431233 [Trametes cingulata]
MEKPKISSDSRIYRPDARKQNSGPKGKKTLGKDIGKLTEIMNVPMDVFFEITSHLKPLDILHLSRTSKDLRNLLCSRNSRHIWVAARRNIVPPMPDCPDDVSEPQFARLVFERICQACGVGQSVNMDYAIPIRLCGACWKANVRNGGKLAREVGLKKKEQGDIFDLLPAIHGTSLVWHQQPYQAVKQASTNKFYEPEFVALAKRYKELRAEADPKALQQFVDDRKADALRRLNFNITMVRWERDFQEENRKNQSALQNERQTAIEEKLFELGYQRDDFPKGNIEFFQIMQQPRKLTPRIWNTVRPKLIEILDAQRKERAEREFRQKWKKRREQLETCYSAFLKRDREQDAQKRMLPGFEDALPCFLDVLTGAEPDDDVTEEESAAAESAVLAHADEYCCRVRHDLANVVRKAREAPFGQAIYSVQVTKARKGKGKDRGKAAGDGSTSMSSDAATELAILDAPTSLFQCNWEYPRDPTCNAIKTFSGMLEHRQLVHRSKPWSSQSAVLVANHHMKGAVERLVTALGLPGDATLSAIQDVISQGRPECSCGFDPDIRFEDEPRYLVLDRLWNHINNRHSFPNHQLQELEHRITFKPVAEKA